MVEKNVIVVFGGSFNPPLNSHFSLAQQIINEYEYVDKVIFVPVNSKYQKRDLIENKHRYNMLKLVCDKNDNFIVSDVELKQNQQLHSIQTLELIKKEYPNKIIYFLLGSDNLKEFNTWYSCEEFVKKFKIMVLERDTDNVDEIINNDSFLKKYKNSFIKTKENIRSNVSSSFVRDKLKRKKDIRYLTPDEVYFYIKENKLYNFNNL